VVHLFQELQTQSGEYLDFLLKTSLIDLNLQLKASRLLTRKPYFYPRNLQAPSSSWILMSQNFDNYTNDLKMYGLIIVTQLRGTIRVTLKPKDSCQKLCHELTLSLFDGESLTFLTNLWTFSYEYLAENDSFSLTFITETDFN
jgi:hypothetical protein